MEGLTRETLVELARMYARNWQTLDGLWFQNVESEYGLEAAVKLDLRNWEKQSTLEAQRIKRALGLDQGGLRSVLTGLSFMSWQVSSPGFVVEEESAGRVVFYYPHCPVQEGRARQGKQEFPCRKMKTTLLSNLAKVLEPRAEIQCVTCPPDPHPQDFWCKWMLTMSRA